MRSKLWFTVATLMVLLSLIAGCSSSGSTKYPEKQISYLLAFDPGGPSDREARRQQLLLEKYLGQKVTVDYKVGAGGALGWAELARSKPDGYVIGGINLPHIVLAPLLQDTGYKTDDLKVVAIFQRTPIGIAVLKDSPYKTLDDFLKAAKEKPESISVSGSGTFTSYQFLTIRLEKAAGVKFKYVPFNGNAPAMTAFLGGNTTATIAATDDMVKYKDQIRILALADEKRFDQLPDAPTFKELKYDLVEVVDRGVAVPKNTPPDVVKKLEEAFLKIANDPKIQEAQKKEGLVPVAEGADAVAKRIETMKKTYADLVKEVKK